MVDYPIRRKILSILADQETTTRSELAAELATDEDVSATDVEALETSLHHNHLPKLDDEQYIEYDVRNGDVVLWKQEDALRSQLGDE